MLRALDHIVLAVKDLDAARRTFSSLGFTLTPDAYHPFGTKNALIQLNGAFLELLAIDDEAKFPSLEAGQFSFAHFNRDFLERRQGASMLVLKSEHVAHDLALLDELGIKHYPKFDFEREATLPDGSKRLVSFANGFLQHDAMKQTGFFLCHNRYPDHFWIPDFQQHANGGQRLESAVFVAPNPSDHHEFFGGFSGQREMRSTSAGLVVETGHGLIEVLTPMAANVLYALEIPQDMPEEGGIAALIISADLDKTEVALTEAGIDSYSANGHLIVQPGQLYGCALVFRDA